MKQNSAAGVGADTGEGLTGPEANASGPFPPGQRHLQCHKCKGWGHVKRVCPSHLNYTRGECQEREHSSPKTGACKNTDSNHRRDPIIAKAVKMADRYHNPDPLIQLIGPVNKSTVILEGKEYPALLDSGAQLSGISLKLAKKLGLKIYQLNTLLDIEGLGKMMYLIWGIWRLDCKLKEYQGWMKTLCFW